jgi:hypothetical protein
MYKQHWARSSPCASSQARVTVHLPSWPQREGIHGVHFSIYELAGDDDRLEVSIGLGDDVTSAVQSKE